MTGTKRQVLFDLTHMWNQKSWTARESVERWSPMSGVCGRKKVEEEVSSPGQEVFLGLSPSLSLVCSGPGLDSFSREKAYMSCSMGQQSLLGRQGGWEVDRPYLGFSQDFSGAVSQASRHAQGLGSESSLEPWAALWLISEALQ